jgi:hypothetical protein
MCKFSKKINFINLFTRKTEMSCPQPDLGIPATGQLPDRTAWTDRQFVIHSPIACSSIARLGSGR